MKRPNDTNARPDQRLVELQFRQASDREAERLAGTFEVHEVSELIALRKLGNKLFGNPSEQYPWPGGQQPYRYGGVIEGGPEEPGVLYLGFFLDPPNVPVHLRRRCLLFRGCKIAEFEAQARLMGMMQ